MASNTVGTLVFWGRVACIFSLILVGSLRAAPEAPALETIVELARTGRNAEAIERYEALPEGVDRPLALLRAVAGCYWRERHFEEARTLYQMLRPTLFDPCRLGIVGRRRLKRMIGAVRSGCNGYSIRCFRASSRRISI